ncbi:hypothetical protein BY458DRAFT_486470 [Sporodiniella umbellata]|nr:hypothetical protein BY458DRAFT_486470 [Sporodiniella umbellata]
MDQMFILIKDRFDSKSMKNINEINTPTPPSNRKIAKENNYFSIKNIEGIDIKVDELKEGYTYECYFCKAILEKDVNCNCQKQKQSKTVQVTRFVWLDSSRTGHQLRREALTCY